MARQEGFEPSAYGLEVRCSIQLSYWRAASADLTFREHGPLTAGRVSNMGIKDLQMKKHLFLYLGNFYQRNHSGPPRGKGLNSRNNNIFSRSPIP